MRATLARLRALLAGHSLRWRITLFTTAASFVAHAVLGVAVVCTSQRSTDELSSQGLAGRAGELSGALAAGAAGGALTDERLSRLAEGLMFSPRGDLYSLQVYDAAGARVAATPRPAPELGLTGEDLSGPGRTTRRRVVAGPHEGGGLMWRVSTRPLPLAAGGGFVAVAIADARYESIMESLGRTYAAAVLLGTLVTGVAAWFIAGTALLPLQKLVRLAGTFAPDQIRSAPELQPMPPELTGFRQEMTAARDRLRDALTSQDQMVSNISHELKTPIAVVMAEAELIDAPGLPQEVAGFVRSVREEMRRLVAVVETFVTLSRIGSGTLAVSPGACDLNEVLLEAVTSVRGPAARRRVSVAAHAAEAPEAPLLRGDAALLTLMFGHVLRNCVRFSDEGSEVVVTARVGPAHCRVTMRDEGPAAPPHLLTVLFDRPVEAPEPAGTRREVGLCIAQRIAELHGGSISVDSPGDRGCEFSINLPLEGRG